MYICSSKRGHNLTSGSSGGCPAGWISKSIGDEYPIILTCYDGMRQVQDKSSLGIQTASM